MGLINQHGCTNESGQGKTWYHGVDNQSLLIFENSWTFIDGTMHNCSVRYLQWYCHLGFIGLHTGPTLEQIPNIGHISKYYTCQTKSTNFDIFLTDILVQALSWIVEAYTNVSWYYIVLYFFFSCKRKHLNCSTKTLENRLMWKVKQL